MSPNAGCLLFLMSIFFPGVTQIVFGIVYGFDLGYIVVGILQLLLTPIVIGWVWSIAWGARGLSAAGAKAAAVLAASAPVREDGEEMTTGEVAKEKTSAAAAAGSAEDQV